MKELSLIKQGLTAVMLRASEQKKLKKQESVKDLLDRLEIMEDKYIQEIENEQR